MELMLKSCSTEEHAYTGHIELTFLCPVFAGVRLESDIEGSVLRAPPHLVYGSEQTEMELMLKKLQYRRARIYWSY